MILSTLTPELNFALEQLSPGRMGQLCELRFRRGQQVTGVFPWGEELICRNGQPIAVTERFWTDPPAALTMPFAWMKQGCICRWNRAAAWDCAVKRCCETEKSSV